MSWIQCWTHNGLALRPQCIGQVMGRCDSLELLQFPTCWPMNGLFTDLGMRGVVVLWTPCYLSYPRIRRIDGYYGINPKPPNLLFSNLAHTLVFDDAPNWLILKDRRDIGIPPSPTTRPPVCPSVHPFVHSFTHHLFRFLCICWQITWKEWHKIWHADVSRWLALGRDGGGA